MPRPPLAVRGVCPDCGRVVTTQAPAGRATWRGQCPRKGCGGYVVARRIRNPDDVPPPDSPTATEGDTDATDESAPATPPPARSGTTPRRKVPRASGYVVPKPPAVPDPDVRPTDPAPAPADRPAPGGDADEHDYRDAGAQPEPRRRPRFGRRAPGPEHVRRVTPYEHLY